VPVRPQNLGWSVTASSFEICAKVGRLREQRQVRHVPSAVESAVGVGRDGVNTGARSPCSTDGAANHYM
jgi:hypothetical protein